MSGCITLIGMPSCGKSTVGVVLAKKAGMRFLDGDLLIQEKTGKLLKDLIRECGDDGFREIENRGVTIRKGQTFRQLYDERCVLYEKYADIVIDETGLRIRQVAEKILDAVGREDRN